MVPCWVPFSSPSPGVSLPGGRVIPLLFFLLLSCPFPLFSAPSSPLGALAAVDTRAVSVGEEVLRQGGNAIDAGIAVALALAYFYPQAGSLGGGGFAVVRHKGRVFTLDFRETAPQGATLQAYLDRSGNPIPEATLQGGKAVAVPAMIFGYGELHRRFGRLPWERILSLVIARGEGQNRVSPRLYRDLSRFAPLLKKDPFLRALFYPQGEPATIGTRIELKGLTTLLTLYRKERERVLRGGALAVSLVEAVREQGGFLSLADLEEYEVKARPPRIFQAFGYEFQCMDLPSSGGRILEGAMRLLEGLGYAPGTTRPSRFPYELSEVLRRVYLFRTNLGDPDHLEEPLPELLSPPIFAKALGTITGTALPVTTLKELLQVAPFSKEHESQETTHISVVDREGNALSMTITLNTPFGSGIFIPSLGIFLNNEMDDFALTPTLPNLYGLIQGKNNLLKPGRRPLSSMTPCIVQGPGTLFALGSPGGSRIPAALLQVLLQLLLFQLPPQEAVDAPRLHHQAFPDVLFYEPAALTPEEQDDLARRGFALQETSGIGEVYGAGVLKNEYFAVADGTRGLDATARVVSSAQGKGRVTPSRPPLRPPSPRLYKGSPGRAK